MAGLPGFLPRSPLSPFENLLARQREADLLMSTMRDCAWCIAHEHGREGLLELEKGLRRVAHNCGDGRELVDAFQCATHGVVWKEP